MGKRSLTSEPVVRKLRIFSLDPSLAGQLDTAGIGQITITVPWEKDLKPGPVGEYLEVVDVDPASNCRYYPVDLNELDVVAQDGLTPSETDPRFHQQMIYAVAMTTIGHFERALGRVALWSSHRDKYDLEEQFVRRLRIYPHALRDRNAYYSPKKKALLFGYFPVGVKDEHNTPGTLVFSCLSHDIIAHETSHALLDGVHPRFNEPVNVDVLAFHEAFADIVALFQHFSYPEVLRSQIAKTRGDLAAESLLGQLAQQFGKASGRGEALRDALGRKNKLDVWEPRKPDPRALEKVDEPHNRGAILVAAVFGAFLKVYRSRTADLFRIASEGTGVLRAGDIHPDLANRLAGEAAEIARQMLQMCIRAIDYCPPVDITFGNYLRALVTSDFDYNPDDDWHRLALLESFRQWGIFPTGISSMSLQALLWPTGEEAEDEATVVMLQDDRRALFVEPIPETEERLRSGPEKEKRPREWQRWDLESDRYQTWRGAEINAERFWRWLIKGKGQKLAPALGIIVSAAFQPQTIFRSRDPNSLAVEVHSVRTAVRRGRRGNAVVDLVVELTQRRRGYFDAKEQREKDSGDVPIPDDDFGDFVYRAGCTAIFDMATLKPRWVIKTPGTIADNKHLERVRRFLTEGGLAPDNAFELTRRVLDAREPFALLHQHEEG